MQVQPRMVNWDFPESDHYQALDNLGQVRTHEDQVAVVEGRYIVVYRIQPPAVTLTYDVIDLKKATTIPSIPEEVSLFLEDEAWVFCS